MLLYLAAAFRPEALCTWTFSVTTRAIPAPTCPAALTGLCLYWMCTSSRPTLNTQRIIYKKHWKVYLHNVLHHFFVHFTSHSTDDHCFFGCWVKQVYQPLAYFTSIWLVARANSVLWWWLPEGCGWWSAGPWLLRNSGREKSWASAGCCLCRVTMAHSLDRGSTALATSCSRTLG